MKILFTKKSRNVKLGKISVSTSPKTTCPKTCPMIDHGCYAKYGPLAYHWRNVEERGISWEAFINEVEAIPKGELWRHNQAGDLAGDGVTIDYEMLEELTKANLGKRGFTYSHYRGEENFMIMVTATDGGFTINLSANGEGEVDELVALQMGPVVTIMPEDFTGVIMTEGGNTIVVCPASVDKLANCKECGICQVAKRKVVIGFPAHGVGKRYIEIIRENTNASLD